jgi:hypothetical protein
MDELPLVFDEVMHFMQQNPRARLPDIAKHLANVFQRTVQPKTASKLLLKLGWSWKIPVRFQLHKYTLHNLEQYLRYISAVQKLDIMRLRFIDEAHFVSKDLTNGKVLGLVNQYVWLKQSTLHQKKWCAESINVCICSCSRHSDCTNLFT